VNAYEIKALGSEVWGGQGGLLSVDELDLLMRLVEGFLPGEAISVLEVGHYYGLSTCGLVHALQSCGGAWRLVSVDAHIDDKWIGYAAPIERFNENRKRYFDDPRLSGVFVRSEALVAPLPYDVVFYDGDHAAEQVRFTQAVIDSPAVSLFVFDDRDFPDPARCCEMLRAAGWADESPELARLIGDKTNPETMTLGVFRR
jgi:hypothetical protein